MNRYIYIITMTLLMILSMVITENLINNLYGSTESECYLNRLYKKYADQYETLDWGLLKAIARVESDEIPTRVNHADPSYGLMQIYCPNKVRQFPGLSDTKWSSVKCSELLIPDTNIAVAATLLDWNIRNFGFVRGVAAYNCWSARNHSPIPNCEYVLEIFREYYKLKKGAQEA
jgi:hypothetical protein